MRWGPYPAYRETDASWLGAIPSGWRLERLKYAAPAFNEKLDAGGIELQYLGMENIESGTGRYVEADEAIESDGLASHYHAGDVLFGKLRPYLAKALLAQSEGVCSSELLVLKARSVEPKYLLYYVLSDGFIKAVDSSTYGSKMPRASWDFIGNLPVAVSTPDEQKSICNFLDREAAKLDTLIAKQNRLIELLQEKRQAFISHAVTKGLNPDAPMKDSGVKWLGIVPAHWEIPPMRAIGNVVRGASPRPAGDLRYFGGDAIPWITVAEITKDDAMYVSETAEGLTAEGREYSRVFPAGTLLFSNSGATLGVPKICSMAACANDGVVGLLSLDKRVNIEFLYFLLLTTTQKLRDEIRQGAGQPNLNTSIVKGIRMGMPPLTEQQQIVEHIKAALGKLDNLTAKALCSINLMREHRSALISAAVTGKIDVREVV